MSSRTMAGASRPHVVVIGGGFCGLAAAWELGPARRPRPRCWSAMPKSAASPAVSSRGGARLEKFYHHWFTSDIHVMELIEELGQSAEGGAALDPDRLVLRPRLLQTLHTPRPPALLATAVLRPLPPRPAGAQGAPGEGLARPRRPDRRRLAARDGRRAGLSGGVGAALAREVRRLGGRSGGGLVLEQAQAAGRQPWQGAAGNGWPTTGAASPRWPTGWPRPSGTKAEKSAPASRSAAWQWTRGGRSGVVTPEATRAADAVIATPALPIVADLVAPHAPGEYVDGLRRIRYLANVCVVLELDRSLSDLYWLNVNDPGFPFVGVIEHTNFEPASTYAGRHIVYLSPLSVRGRRAVADAGRGSGSRSRSNTCGGCSPT